MRALLSVYDKAGLVDLASGLGSMGWELVASGKTAAALAEAGIDHVEVAAYTGAPEMLGGRVKTLHPRIHGGILADRSDPAHLADLEAQDVAPIDLVVCNLYPFSSDPSIELIDVGGPTMVRAAAKNHAHVGVVVDPGDYDGVLGELRSSGSLSDDTRRRLARAAFAHVAAYDAAIVAWFDSGGAGGEPAPSLAPTLHLALDRAQELRYGENPHQAGARYRVRGTHTWWDGVVQHGGSALSYLNLFDADAGWRLVGELATGPDAAVAIMKHANPCGVALAASLEEAYRRALECDPVSAFGGVVALGGACTLEVARALADGPQADVVVAPSFAPGAVEVLVARRKATRHSRGPAPHRRRPRAAQPGRGVPGTGARPSRVVALGLAGADEGGADRRAVARRRAGLAGVRPDVLQRHRGGGGRPGPRGGRGPAEQGGGGPHRGVQGGGPGPGRCGRERRLLPLPRRPRRAGRGGHRGGGPAGRVGARRRGGGGGGRARYRHGAHRRAPLPPLSAP